MLTDSLIQEHLDLVPRIARAFRTRLPRAIALDELISDGNFGLLAAARTFDARKGVTFAKYAARRIHGAMQDGLRQRDWVSRSLRAGAAACDVPRILSFSRIPFDGLIDRCARLVEDQASCRESIEHLKRVGRRERLALILYFLEGASMKQTGQILAMTEAGASLLIKRTLTRMKQPRGRRDRGVLHFSPHTNLIAAAKIPRRSGMPSDHR